MRKKLGFVLCITLFGCAVLATRYYEVDLTVWHFLGGGNGIDPAVLHLRGEFVESNLGTAVEPDGSFTVRMVAQQYLFVPQCVVVPAGVPVRFRFTSADAVHLMSFGGTSYALRATPGYVSTGEFTFPSVGEFKMPCREFCGPGHYTMRARVRVVPRDQFASLHADERRICASQ